MGATIQEISNEAFDYIVIGGGTCGLTVAARLAEDINSRVVVLEAGPENLDDPLINVPGQFGLHFGNPKYDWSFKTVPQKNSNNNVYLWPRGRTLGGTSAINFLVWNKPPAHDIDAWEALGNPGWNWKRYLEYSKKVESFSPPTDEMRDEYRLLYDISSHGRTGPLKTSFANTFSVGDVPFQQTLNNKGIETAKDPLGGDSIGTWMAARTVDPSTHTRSFSATAFYIPNKDKPNFKVLCDAVAHRLVTSGGDDLLVAESVEFEYQGQKHVVYARKEIILSAGALKSPQLLELSGIGDRNVLEPLGIKTKIDLPGVGANAQEHNFCVPIFELNPAHTYETFDALRDKDYAAEQLKLHHEGKGVYHMGISGFTFVPLKKVVGETLMAKDMIAEQRKRIENHASSLPPGLKEQFELQLKFLESERSGDCEVVSIPGYFSALGAPDVGKTYISIPALVNHPFSRGTIHIASDDPNVQPVFDPHYFEEEFDLQLFAEIVKFIRRLPETEPFKSMVSKEVSPGPECITDDDVKNFIKDTMMSAFHTAGTASMLPRAKNGVVDSNLRVYGTKNVRVVDLSIIPLHIAAHTQATAYAIAEQAADIINGNLSLGEYVV